MANRKRRRKVRDVTGILLLDKPLGLSSNQTLQRAKRIFDAAKAGHTGNLDVMASGLLPLCFGEATKVSQYLLNADKRYLADFTFGATTTTGDAEGEVVATYAVDELDEATLRRAMAGFVGDIEQVPPMYSALKRDGQPLYKLAKQGIEVERAARQVSIREFELRAFRRGIANVEVACSKGTYIRTLAEDLGTSLGNGAHVSALRRTTSGPFDIGQAVTLEKLEEIREVGGAEALDELLMPLDSPLNHLPGVRLPSEACTSVTNGQSVRLSAPDYRGNVRMYDAADTFLGIGEVLADGRIAPRRLMRQIQAGTGN